jgi:PAS domain-containing protein
LDKVHLVGVLLLAHDVVLQVFALLEESLQLEGQRVGEDAVLAIVFGRIHEAGRLINAEGRFIDENGGFVDLYGNPIAEDGTLLIKDSWDEPTEVPKEPTPI